MKSCAKYHGRYSCFLNQHPESDGQVKYKGEPVDDKKIRLFGSQKYSERKHRLFPRFKLRLKYVIAKCNYFLIFMLLLQFLTRYSAYMCRYIFYIFDSDNAELT